MQSSHGQSCWKFSRHWKLMTVLWSCAGVCHVSNEAEAACPQVQCCDFSGVLMLIRSVLKNMKVCRSVMLLCIYADTMWCFHDQKEEKAVYASFKSLLTSSSASALNSWLNELGLMAYDFILLHIKYWQPRSVTVCWHLDKCLWLDV